MKRVAFLLFLSISFLSTSYLASAECFTEPVLFSLMQNVTSAIRQAQARYDSGNVTGAAELARKILAKYPDNVDAKAILVKCIATEKEDYEKAVESMSVSQLLDFQKKYPNSDFSSDVEKRINDLPLWLNAKNQNTVASYKHYLSESTHQLYKREAVDSIDELTVKQAYDAAVATNTIKAFEQFRSAYPGSRYDKQASNKIARLMADKFNSKSTYDDKYKALAYATNEMTRDYVKNKYNKATSGRGSSTSTSSTGSSYSSSYNSGYNSSSSYGTGTYSKSRGSYNSYAYSEKICSFGVIFQIDFGPTTFQSGSTTYHLDPNTFGIGGLVRFGDQNNTFNFITGLKLLYTGLEISSYYDTDYENSTDVVLPLELNWNCVSSADIGMYFGFGYHLGFTPLQAIKLSWGLAWTHGDFSIYYMKYFLGPFYTNGDYAPYCGIGYTYYF